MKCGTPLQEGVRFCPKCGANIEQTVQQPMAPQQPYYGQTQPYVSMPKKSNKKLIIAVIAIVVIIVVVGLLAYFFVFSKGGIVGKWEIVSMESKLNGVSQGSTAGDGTKVEFKSDGTTITTNPDGSTSSGKWEIKNGKLCNPEAETSGFLGSNCMDYKLSNGGKTLTLSGSSSQSYGGITYNYEYTMTLRKV